MTATSQYFVRCTAIEKKTLKLFTKKIRTQTTHGSVWAVTTSWSRFWKVVESQQGQIFAVGLTVPQADKLTYTGWIGMADLDKKGVAEPQNTLVGVIYIKNWTLLRHAAGPRACGILCPSRHHAVEANTFVEAVRAMPQARFSDPLQ